MVRLAGALPPTVGIGIANRLEAEAARLHRAAAPAERQSFDAYGADALARMLEGAGPGRGRARRPGGGGRPGRLPPGPCPPAASPATSWAGGRCRSAFARDLADDAFVKAVTHDGVRIEAVAHFGRYIPAELRTALDLGRRPASTA